MTKYALIRKPTISPLEQAGSWQLNDFLIIVGKQGSWGAGGFWPVEIVQNNPYGAVHAAQYNELTPCYAALAALQDFFGGTSDEALEFSEHYPCSDDVEKQNAPETKGWAMKDDLDGLGAVPLQDPPIILNSETEAAWQLNDYEVVVGKKGLWGSAGKYPVEIYKKRGRHRFLMEPPGQFGASTACEAALLAVAARFGGNDSPEADEFRKYYGQDCKDREDAFPPNSPAQKSWAMKDDLDGVKAVLPAWVRGGRRG